ncbi:hypothetical protein TNCV_2452231 [Trichonephila clavipes]|nr:hypothetical protein TNCV_2452231 [Trichonephila clavipes]
MPWVLSRVARGSSLIGCCVNGRTSVPEGVPSLRSGSSHPANFSGCPQNPINTKPNKTKATKNVWQERAAARKQSQKQTKPSFAEVVKGTNNNSLDAKEVITKMAQMMSQWGEMLSLLQSKL